MFTEGTINKIVQPTMSCNKYMKGQHFNASCNYSELFGYLSLR